MTTRVAAAYSATGGAWQAGPGRIYDDLAGAVLVRCPIAVGGAVVLDLGAGTGAASRAAIRAGAARVVGVDAAIGMLTHDAGARPPATVGDALELPFADTSFDVVVAAFSLNHLRDPAAGLSEIRRVTRRGGAVVASAYAGDDDHQAKAAAEAALRDRGWTPEHWYTALKEEAIPLLSTVDGFTAAARAAGLDPCVEPLRVQFPDLSAAELVEWRLGMAQTAPFVARLPAAERTALVADAVARLGSGWPVLERSILVLTAVI